MAEQEKSGFENVFKQFASSKPNDKILKKAVEHLSKGDFNEAIKGLDQKNLQEFFLFMIQKENENASVDAGSSSSSSHHNIPMSQSFNTPRSRGIVPSEKPGTSLYAKSGKPESEKPSLSSENLDVDSLRRNFPSSDWQKAMKAIEDQFVDLDNKYKQLRKESPKGNRTEENQERKPKGTQREPSGTKEKDVKQSDPVWKPNLFKLTDHLKNRDKMVDFLDEENKAVCLRFSRLQEEVKNRETTERATHMAEIETERTRSRKQLEDLKQKVKEADERANNNERFLNEKFQEFDEDKRKADAEVSQLLVEDKKKLDLIKKLQQDSRSLQAINGTLNEDIKKSEYKLQKTKDESVRKVEQMRDEFENERKSLHKKLQEMEKEKNEFRDRFSKIAGQKLVEKNADIADLSDPNRAMKLSERFGQIYDDDWTDAFQALTDRKMKPKEAITVLMDILKRCYKTCEEVAARQLEDLKLPLIQPVRFVDEVSKARAGVKEKPRISTKHEKMLKDARRQMWDASVGTVTQLMMAELKDWLKKDVGPKAFEDTKVYIEKCAETCWLSVLHDPPIYLKTDTKEGEKLDVNLYTAYSASGEKIDYLVWPPLFNGKEGGLLSKGVAEPLRTIKKDQKK